MEQLAPAAGHVYADVTLGGGGHARAILERSAPDGRLIGADRDPSALEAARAGLAQFGDRVVLRKARMSEIREILSSLDIERVDGVIADLGVSSAQLDQRERGFSLANDGPIDMRMDPTEGESALDLIADCNAEELANIIFRYGEEHRSRKIARSLRSAWEEGALETTTDLRRSTVPLESAGLRTPLEPKSIGRLITLLPAQGGSGASTTALHVAEAIALTGANQVDTSSGVESAPGVKDGAAIAAFVEAARA